MSDRYSPEDIQRVMRGEIPWSDVDFFNVMDKRDEIAATPKDDWDLTEQSLSFRDAGPGEISKITLNRFNISNQVGSYMKQKYRGSIEFMAHRYRYFEIQNFLAEHLDALKRDGWVKDDAESLGVSESLVKSLCVLPYTHRRIRDGEAEYVFSYDEVLNKAEEFQTES